jgi:DNA-binding NarL/FixJ family response regulator
MTIVNEINRCVRALCVARHPYLSAHFASLFSDLGLDAKGARGLEEALATSRTFQPDVVICEYELLTALPADVLESDWLLSQSPVIAVSLTRRAQEAQLMHMNGVSAFLYLPMIEQDAAMRAISAAVANGRQRYVPSSPSISRIDEVEASL